MRLTWKQHGTRHRLFYFNDFDHSFVVSLLVGITFTYRDSDFKIRNLLITSRFPNNYDYKDIEVRRLIIDIMLSGILI